MNPLALSRILGCLGLGLGAMEVTGPGCVAAWLGLRRRSEAVGWFGLRTIATGLMVLARPRNASGSTLQAVGGAVDMMMLLPALSDRNPRRDNARFAFMMLAGITALDAVCAAIMVGGTRAPSSLRTTTPHPTPERA